MDSVIDFCERYERDVSERKVCWMEFTENNNTKRKAGTILLTIEMIAYRDKQEIGDKQ